MFSGNCISRKYTTSSNLHKNKNIFFTDHWSKHRKTAGSLSFLGGTAYNADIAQRCARLRRRSIKTFVHFLELTALPQ
jgi:hypothetical protein